MAYANFFCLGSFVLLAFFVEFFLLVVLVRQDEIERKTVFIEVVNEVPEKIFAAITIPEFFQVILEIIAHKYVLK